MGAKVCNEDATLFGHLVQGVYHDRGPFYEYVIGILKKEYLKFNSLVQYFEQILRQKNKIFRKLIILQQKKPNVQTFKNM
jgi:hypothetical protein